MIVTDIVGEQPFQMSFIQSDHMIQQVPAAALDPELSNSVLPGALPRSPNAPDFHRTNRSGNFGPILGVSVTDEKPGSGLVWKGFPQLLDNPQASWMARHMEMQDTLPIMADDEEAIKHAERESWDVNS